MHKCQSCRRTYRAVVKQVEQRDEESTPVLPVPTDHGVEMRAEGGVRVVTAVTSNHHVFGSVNGLLHLIRHLQPCNCLHL